MSDKGRPDGDDYDKKCSDYIVSLRKELTAVQADVLGAQQSRRYGQGRIETLRGEQRHLHQQLAHIQTRHELVTKLEQLQEQVAQKKQLVQQQCPTRERRETGVATKPCARKTTSCDGSVTTKVDEAKVRLTEEVKAPMDETVPFSTGDFTPSSPSKGSSPRRRERRMDIV